jgi:hypothetical protein
MSCLKIINKFKKSRKMKTKVIITSVIVLFLLAIFTLVSCRKDREDPPTLRVEIKPTQVVYSGSATLTWQGENLASLKINGENQSKLSYGSMPLVDLQENKTYNFVAIGLDGTTISRSVSVEVNKPVPKLSVVVTPNTVVPYKGSATVSWQGENLASLKVNGVNRSELTVGSTPLTNLVEDTTFNFSAVGLDGSTLNQTAEVKVAEPTRTDTLCGNYWTMIEWKFYYEGTYGFAALTDDDKAERIYFYKDGTGVVINKDEKVVGNGYWSWVGQDSIKTGTKIHRYQLSKDTFTLYKDNDSTIVTYKGHPL